MQLPRIPVLAYHRGRHGQMPDGSLIAENSLESFTRAIQEGAQIIELDIECGLAVCHGPEISPEAPHLSEVLDVVSGQCRLNIEIKSPLVTSDVCDLLEDALATNRWSPDHFILSSFDHGVLLQYRKRLPMVQIGALVDAVVLPEYIDLLALKGVNNIHTHWHSALMDFESGQEMISAARRNGMQLWVYTVNEPSLFQKMAAYGADVVFTDNPAVGGK